MKFSIIVPIYKVEEYLGECVDSVLAQDYTDYELILVDDGSPDNCGKICDEYAQKYPNIKVIHKENGGLSDARNFGIKQAKGDYLIFLDSDDYWEGTTILSDLSRIIERDNYPDLVLYDYSFGDSEPNENFLSYNRANADFVNDFKDLITNYIYHSNAWTKVIRRNIIFDNNLFFEKGILQEDSPFSFDLAFHIKRYSVYNKCLYRYRLRNNSITSVVGWKNLRDLSIVLIKRLDVLKTMDDKYPIKEGLKEYIGNHFRYSFYYYNQLSVRDRANLYFLQKKLWDKCCQVLGEKYMRDKIFGDRKIKNLPFILVVFVNYLMAKYYKMRNK